MRSTERPTPPENNQQDGAPALGDQFGPCPASVECAFFGRDARFHHIGLAVRSIRQASPPSEPVAEPAQKVSIAFINLSGVTVELLEPLGDDSPVARSVREGVRLLHICFEVPSLETALRRGRSAGFHQISAPAASVVFGGRRVVWVFSPQYGLFELVEQNTDAPSRWT